MGEGEGEGRAAGQGGQGPGEVRAGGRRWREGGGGQKVLGALLVGWECRPGSVGQGVWGGSVGYMLFAPHNALLLPFDWQSRDCAQHTPATDSIVINTESQMHIFEHPTPKGAFFFFFLVLAAEAPLCLLPCIPWAQALP